MTLETIIAVVTIIASFLGSVLVIWAFTTKIKNALQDSVKVIVSDMLTNNNAIIDTKIQAAFEKAKIEINAGIDSVSCKLDTHSKEQAQSDILTKESIKLLKESLIEAYKQDIRAIYYKLRESGEIEDHDKAYVDKVFPKYIALGGNSDIEAKYAEMCRVYEKITQENFDKARAKRKAQIKKEKTIEPINSAELEGEQKDE